MTDGTIIDERAFAEGETVFQAGQPSDTVFIVKQGAVTVELTYRGRPLCIDCGPGDILGDAGFVFKQAHAPEKPAYGGTATAQSDVVLLALPREQLDAALDATPTLIRAWIASFVTRSMKVIDQLTDS